MLWQGNPPRRDTTRRTGLAAIYPTVRHSLPVTHSRRSWRWNDNRLLDRANRVVDRAKTVEGCAVVEFEAEIRRAFYGAHMEDCGNLLMRDSSVMNVETNCIDSSRGAVTIEFCYVAEVGIIS